PNVREFLTYFLPRKVMAGDSFLRAAASVTGKLVAWLEAKGWAEPELAADLTDDARTAARNLPRAQKLARDLYRWIGDNVEPVDRADEDRFAVTRILGDRIWLRGSMDGAYGPIRLPEEYVRQLAVGWTISGAVARRGRACRLVEVWSVEAP
ncbi:MAG: hypothetical protein IT459_24090, partial [Planctomycetes bacterium]|nr:hypothetical protein [Planctomycetota bacterium]